MWEFGENGAWRCRSGAPSFGAWQEGQEVNGGHGWKLD